MNLLIDPLPGEVLVGEELCPVRTDFRYWVLFELLMLDDDVPGEEKFAGAVSLCFEGPPRDLSGAVDAMLWFYRGGKPVSPEAGGGKPAQRVYSFACDDACIYAAFLDQYGVDLTTAQLHWWRFRAMFRALRSDNEIVRIMGYRAMEIDPKMSDREKKFYREMKERYALPRPLGERRGLDAINAALAGDGDVAALLEGGGDIGKL